MPQNSWEEEEEKLQGTDRPATREISFHELASKALKAPAKKVRPAKKTESIRDNDPFFHVIDAGHDLLMTGKQNRRLRGKLPYELEAMILELEAIMKEITLSAMEDDFDYRVKMDHYFFLMMRINYLGSIMSYRLNRFAGSRTAAQKYLGSLARDHMPEVLQELRTFAEIGEELTLATNQWMDMQQAQNALEPEWLEERERRMEEARIQKEMTPQLEM